MKNICGNSGQWHVAGDKMKSPTRKAGSGHVSLFGVPRLRGSVNGGRLKAELQTAFTLIELLTVMAIIGVLAALILPVAGAVKKHQYIYNSQTQMAQLETAIDRYKAAYGFYPPDTPGNSMTNHLYYELVGTTNNGGNYVTLNGSAQNIVRPGVRRVSRCGRFCELQQTQRGRGFNGGQEFSPRFETEPGLAELFKQ